MLGYILDVWHDACQVGDIKMICRFLECLNPNF